MKKSLLIILVMLNLGIKAQEETGRIGVNTETPRATLDIQSSTYNKNQGRTNEGIIPPQITKSRLAAIYDSQLVSGTLVYVISTTGYKGNNTKVEDVNEPGLYLYNDTYQKWEKIPNDYNEVKKNKQMVPLSKVNMTNRSKITGVDGTWEKVNGAWGFTGVCKPISLYYNTGSFTGYYLNTNTLPTQLLTDAINAWVFPEPTIQWTTTLVDSDYRIIDYIAKSEEDAYNYIKNYPKTLYSVKSFPGDHSEFNVECRPTDLWLYEED